MRKHKTLGVLFIWSLLLSVHFVAADSDGCIFLRDDKSIRCQNTTLADVGESLYILTTVVRNKPQIIDIDYCKGGTQLFPIFNQINTSVDTVRIRRSSLRTIHMDVFIPVANTLRDLDLSHNHLTVVPRALLVLWSLEHLNLQHNRIVFVRPGSIFDGLPNLREINFANNYLGLADEAGDNFRELHGYQLRGTLGLEEFSLGRAARSIESLNLKGNRLVTVPVQISNFSMPELRHLDLSENVLGRLAVLSPALLPKLEFLDLHSNLLQTMQFYSLPIALRYLDITENPFHCDCGIVWLIEWNSANTSKIRLPTCNSPDSVRGKSFDKIVWNTHCKGWNSTLHEKQGNRDYDVVQVASSATVINLSWRVKLDGSSKKWTVVYRKASDSPYQMTLSSPTQRNGKSNDAQEAVLTDRIQHLQPSTIYIVCIAVIHDGKYTIEPNKCQKVRTKSFEEIGDFERRVEVQSKTTRLTTNDIKTDLEDVTVSADSIMVKWKLSMLIPFVEGQESVSVRHEWTLRIRRTGSDNYTDIPVFDITKASETNQQLYEYGISDLAPRTHYDVCLVDIDHRLLTDTVTTLHESKGLDRDNDTMECRTVLTEGNYVLYATEIAAICAACGICLVVIAVTIYLCRQKRLIKWKPKLMRNWFQRTLSDTKRPPTIGSSTKYATAATIPRVKCDTMPIQEKPTNKMMVGTWNTLRMPYKEFPQIDNLNENEWPKATSYKDALSTVTIYKSGHSEC